MNREKKRKFDADNYRAGIHLKVRDLGRQLSEIEQRAGIAAGWDLKLGGFASPDYILRDAYLTVPDLELRKALIETITEILSHKGYERRAYWACAEADLAVAKVSDRWSHVHAAWIAAGLVAIGGVLFGTVGGIAGAAAGYFLGLGMLQEYRKERLEQIARAQAEIKRTQEHYENMERYPPLFSDEEVRTGVSDRPPVKPMTPEEMMAFINSLGPAPLG
jgi:hypothetical protein